MMFSLLSSKSVIAFGLGFTSLFMSGDRFTNEVPQNVSQSLSSGIGQTLAQDWSYSQHQSGVLIAGEGGDKVSAPVRSLTPLQPGGDSYQAISESYRGEYKVRGSQVFAPGQLSDGVLKFSASDLLSVLRSTRQYFSEHASEDPVALRSGILGTQGVTVVNVLETLDFMITVLQEDISSGRKVSRLQDARFINTHFKVMTWSPHNPQDGKQKQLRLTKYAVFIHSGSRTRTATHTIPLYRLRPESSGDSFYLRYTKQDVLAGIYEVGGKEYGKAEPLAYLTREGLEDALLQGTILIRFVDGSEGIFNVDKNNGIPFIRGVAPRDQKRYWYFQEVEAIRGYGHSIETKIPIRPGVTFAGDVLNIGLGRIVVLEYGAGSNKQLQLGVIADTGGAFIPNLYQLDFLAGTFSSKAEFSQYIQRLPEYVNAYVLIKK